MHDISCSSISEVGIVVFELEPNRTSILGTAMQMMLCWDLSGSDQAFSYQVRRHYHKHTGECGHVSVCLNGSYLKVEASPVDTTLVANEIFICHLIR